ncbi:MAG: 16S rRNA (cytosine(1402)-N(4))-methyltransferase RsmH [Nakamurella sp.]
MPVEADGDESMTGGDRHIPVLAARVSELLAPALIGPTPVIIDATLGLGGHAAALLAQFPQLHIIGIDRDPAALAHARTRLEAAGTADRLTVVHAVYDEIATVATQYAPGGLVDGILFDLGVSSMQLDRTERGFAYSVDSPLDMRMDPTVGITAADIIADYSQKDLARILRDYGEERFASRVAAAIVRRRQVRPIVSSGDLVEILRSAIPAATRKTGGHPGKRTFQALRIEVNDELGALTRGIPAALDSLKVGGRIVVMSYQSLEDRIVKRAIAPTTKSTTPLDLPVELAGHEPVFHWLTRGAELPSDAETNSNPRAASARLRAAERMRASL